LSDADRLLGELEARSQGSARIQLATIWQVFRKVVRGYTGDVAARARLAELLDVLAARGAVRLPRSNGLWDRSADPPLPAWAQLVAATSRAGAAVDPRAVAWPPELAFAARAKRVPLLPELLAIQSFLAGGGRERPPVPLRERSVEVFGDEKRLEALLATRLFREHQLTAALLRCYEVAPPLVWERRPGDSGPGPLLILENLHTYESFRCWNRDSGRYVAIAYGHGSEFKATCRDLPRLCADVAATRIAYFGDLDLEGLRIASHAAAILRSLERPLELEPAELWYERLLDKADRATSVPTRVDPSEPALAWLPSRLAKRAIALFGAGKRLPQELVGLDELRGP